MYLSILFVSKAYQCNFVLYLDMNSIRFRYWKPEGRPNNRRIAALENANKCFVHNSISIIKDIESINMEANLFPHKLPLHT